MKTALSAMIDNFLHEHRLTQTWLAAQAGVSCAHINSLVKGNSKLSIKMAHNIGAAFDSVKLARKPWSEHLLRVHLTDIAYGKLAELSEYTKQQEQDK